MEAQRFVRGPTSQPREGKHGEGRVMPARESCLGREKTQESYVLGFGLNRRIGVADSYVEQDPEGEGCKGPAHPCANELAPIFGSSDNEVGMPCRKPGRPNDKRVQALETAYGRV